MKSYRYLLSATALALFLGCSGTSSTTPNDATSSQADGVESKAASQDDAATLEEVKGKVGEAADVTREFAAQEMQDYADSLKNKLKELDAQREQLKQKGEELAGDARQRWEDRLSALEDKRKKLQEDLDRLAGASGDAWQEMRKGIDAAWDDLKKATDEAAKEFE
jgi:predicted nuclease with TOPRIM domain